ncbi:YtxH domain-containing protein [Tuanshanicoccus lijuaniae]|uniref:YtxH domain-containing protein n=1 Tax=Aerococcaceae bacterium zg-1292 TaxID=2774330 RepID=UPI001936CD5F|nr:YtxH domain-containing protein [Aerococcaceae bacterium zg-1292]MBF6625728.1 YtxH domain-containing protein [Aerococcaceae bacterium zg-BR9]MBF6978700.1 YtxH domain-containing protein [Aerococcaceae bacterium zg-BR22]MBS4457043.1 YtxH domain-containing protein [Aerococcaceae bacterium zg-A91]MBS4458897.1 YtxH domain-containing protein [Aerococcaceae bacterium zg-BR33]
MSGFKSGLFWGAVFGGLAGLMNAPQKGSQTRKELSEYLTQVKEDATDLKFKTDHLQALIDRIIHTEVKQTMETVEDVSLMVRRFLESNQPRINRVQRKLIHLQENLEQNMNELRINEEK